MQLVVPLSDFSHWSGMEFALYAFFPKVWAVSFLGFITYGLASRIALLILFEFLWGDSIEDMHRLPERVLVQEPDCSHRRGWNQAVLTLPLLLCERADSRMTHLLCLTCFPLLFCFPGNLYPESMLQVCPIPVLATSIQRVWYRFIPFLSWQLVSRECATGCPVPVLATSIQRVCYRFVPFLS